MQLASSGGLFVKVCCIADAGEAELAIRAGASAIGLDVCSGLRLNGRLDAGTLRDFFDAIH